MALMAATGPPPNFLMPLVTGFPLLAGLAALRAGAPPPGRRRPRPGARLRPRRLELLARDPRVRGHGAGLALAGLRPRPRTALAFAAGAALGAAPLLAGAARRRLGASVVTASSAVTAIRPRWLWGQGVLDLGHALRGLAGLQVPLVVDGRERADLPAVLVVLLAAASSSPWPRASARGARCRSSAGPAALAGAFWLSRRTGPDELRYLYGLNAPVLALAGAGSPPSGRGAAPPAWRPPSPSSCRGRSASGARRALARPRPRGARVGGALPRAARSTRCARPGRAAPTRASSSPAGSRSRPAGRSIASQAWNERIPGDPLRFRDEVDLDPAPAWVLSTRFSRGMPRAGGFRDLVRGMGGSFEETDVGDFVVFHGFRPPYDEARPVPAAHVLLETAGGAPVGREALDRDPATAWTSAEGLARGSGITARVTPARRLSALVLLVDLEESPLGVPWVASVGGEVVAQGPGRAGFQWVNGAPRAGRQALLAVPLGDREAGEVRLAFQGPGPRLAIAEAFLYGPQEEQRPSSGARSAADAFDSARAGRWDEAVRLYAQAVRLEPDRASHHAGWARARWRAAHRRWLDVESLDDGGRPSSRSDSARPSRERRRPGNDARPPGQGPTTSSGGSGRPRRPSPGTPPPRRAASPPRTSRAPCGTSRPR
jgi:hypothetical protein